MKEKFLRFVMTSCFAMATLFANAETVGGLCGIEGDMMVTWELNLDCGLLTISGYGRMADFDDPSEAPWYSYSKSIVHLVVEEGITHISQAGFWYMPYLKSVRIAESVVTIGDYAFCEAPLTIVQPTHWTGSLGENLLPDGLRKIGNHAFAGTLMDNITLPTTLENIGSAAFAYNDRLLSVTSLATVPPTAGRAVFFECSKLWVIYVPDDEVETYDTADGWATYTSFIVPQSGRPASPDKSAENNLEMPHSVYVTNLGKTNAIVACSLPDGAIAWNLQYRQEASENEEEMRWVAIGNLTTRSYTIEDLKPATDYAIRLQSVFSGDELSDWTRVLTFTTNEESANKQETAFTEYKEVKKTECEAMAMPEIDDDYCRELITKAKDDITNLAFDKDKTLEENLAALDAIADKLGIDLEEYRASLPYTQATGVTIDETTFPDENFRNWVLSQKYGKDGILTEEEIAKVESIDVAYQDIKSLKGIEYFTAMEYLLCGSEYLTEIDISKNTNLKWLRCSQSKLTSLDVSKNAALEELRCHNNQLTALDVSNNPLLENLDCESNKLTELDVSQNPKLKHLDCYYNPLTSLDVSHNPALEALYCYELPLGTLDVTKNPALQSLVCTGMQLTTLDLSQNPELNYLSCDGNELTTLDITQNPKLYFLRCYGNKLAALDLTKASELESLECYDNQLTALDVTQNPALKTLDCQNNQIAALDVTKNTKLESMNCGGNPIKTLDLSQNTALKHLYCWGNQLTTLDLSNNPALTDLACHQNMIKGEAMNALIESLPTITDQFLGNWHVIYSEGEQNVITTTQVEAALAKGWKPMYFDSYWKPYEGGDSSVKGVKIEKGLENAAWYDLSGRRLTARPTLKGVYIMNGKKYIIK